jgi:Fic family protein
LSFNEFRRSTRRIRGLTTCRRVSGAWQSAAQAVIRWQKRRFRDFWRRRSATGRPAIEQQHIAFIRRISGDHPEYGEDRIALELELKFGICHSAATVRKYMVKPSRPRRGAGCKQLQASKDLFTFPAPWARYLSQEGTMPRITGRYERTRTAGEEVAAFIPLALPPRDPPLRLEGDLGVLLTRAEASLGRLDLASAMVPSLGWLLYSFVRKEAVISSQIEGTQSTLMDLFAFEATGALWPSANDDLQEVCNYLEAVAFARQQLQSPEGLPISTRLLCQTHQRLLRGVRGANKSPGELRRSQNWLGGTRPGNAAFVPPPPQAVGDALGELERFIHADSSLPPLVRAGLCHVQFETIHPFLDGNGRLGRLLIPLLLEHWKLLRQPLLYLSLFFKQHRAEYYRRLDAVRAEGDFEAWLAFFLEGTAVVAEEAVATIQALFALVSDDRRLDAVRGPDLSHGGPPL